ncbi:MAG: hypothetical protein HY721_24095 [Planctomycetes bacterium]|nr:hypothetical protein [Planctomycetota bacterium]
MASFLATCALGVLPACRTFEKPKFNGDAGVAGEPVLVVPFSEPRRSLWYGESANGVAVAEAFKDWARRNADPDFPEGDAVEQVLTAVRDWPGKKITSEDWKKLTMGMGLRYVLYGEIEELSLTRPGRIGLLEPNVRARYTVVDVGGERPRVAYPAPALQVEYGTGHETEIPWLEVGADEAAARRLVLTKLGAQIGKDLYGYYR